MFVEWDVKSFEHMPTSGIAGLNGRSIFTFFEICPHWLPKRLDQFALLPPMNFLSPFLASICFGCFASLSYPTWCKMRSQSSLNLNLLIGEDVKHFLRYFLAIVISSFENNLFRLLARCLIGSFFFSLLWFWSSLYILDINCLLDALWAKILSLHSVDYFFCYTETFWF